MLLGAACITSRVYSRHETQVARGDSIWRLTYDISFHAKAPGARIWAAFPLDTRHARVFRQELLHTGMRTERVRPGSSKTREVTAVAEHAGECRLRAEFDVHLSPQPGWRPSASAADISAEMRAKCLQSERAIQVSSPVIGQTLEKLSGDRATKIEVVERIFEYCLVSLGVGGDDAPRDAAGAIQQAVAGPLGRARAMTALCRACKVPARLVTGFEIKRDVNTRPIVWVEVLANGDWEPYDPENGFSRELPHHFLPVRRGGTQIVRAKGGTGLRVTNAIVRLPPPPGVVGSENPRLADIVDLTRLPLDIHEVLSLVLLLPFGALVTSVFRTVIGFRTFGTFTPTLLALSFVYADWRTGLVVLAAVLILGLTTRVLLDRLKLLMVPRLSVLLTLVAFCVVFGVSLLDYLSLTPSPQAVLLPMVILTMAIERFYVTAEEDSLRYATQLLGGTLLVAFCCYLVLNWKQIGRMILVYPEIHFFTVAALVLLGRYTGYRLTELWRFRHLAGPQSDEEGP